MPLSERLARWLPLLLIPLAGLYYQGLADLPFHPDETSLLYQSRDFELLFSQPGDLFWQPERDDLDQKYRALNPPLPKYMLAIGRLLGGYGAAEVGQDWDWSATWEQNAAAGALPPPELLRAARAASATAALAAVLLVGCLGKRLQGQATAWLAMALMGLNAAVLLHGRRAMAEGSLLFTVSLALWTFCDARRRPALAGAAAALAAASKLSAGALAPVGLLAAMGLLQGRRAGLEPKRSMRNAVWYLGSLALVFLALNPLLWRSPLRATAEILRARKGLLAMQQAELQQRAPEHLLQTPAERLAGLITELYLSPVRFSEFANYRSQTAAAEARYAANPLHNLLRGSFFGTLLFALGLAGMAFAGLHGFRQPGPHEARLVLAASTLAMAAALLLAVPLPFQRYYLPLVPMASLWAAYAVASLAGK